MMLPTGVGCTVTFFALHAIGRTPAMLNFTAGVMNLTLGLRSGERQEDSDVARLHQDGRP